MLETPSAHPDDPQEDDDSRSTNEQDSPSGRYAANERIKNDESVQKYILAMCLYGASSTDLVEGLQAEFGIIGKKNLGTRQKAKIQEYRAKFPDDAIITAELEKARRFIIEKRPESAWRLLPEARALMAPLLSETNATPNQLSNIFGRFMPTISPNLKTFGYQDLADTIARPGWSRELLAEYMRNNPMPLKADLAAQARTRALFEFEKESRLARFKNGWIFDDANRSLLVALLDLGRAKATPPAIAAVLNSEIAGANVSPSFIYIRSESFGGYKEFSDFIRIGTDEIAPGLHARAESLINRFESDKQARNQPEWLRTDEMKAFAGVLLGETELSYALIAWASGAKFGNETQMSTIKEHTRTHGGRRDLANDLLSGVSPEIVEQARSIDLRTLGGYENLTAIQKQSVNLEMGERFEPMRKIVNSIAQKSGSTVPRVFLFYLSQGRMPSRAVDAPEVRKEDIKIVPAVRIEFAGDSVENASDIAKAAENDARELWKRLVEELGRLERREQIRRVGPLVRALVQAPDTDPILHIVLKRTWFEKGKANDEILTFNLDEQYMNRLKKRAQSADA